MLEGQPQLQALTLLEHLQEQYPGQYGRSGFSQKLKRPGNRIAKCETAAFRVLKNNEIKQYGEYRTQRLVLEAWDKLGF